MKDCYLKIAEFLVKIENEDIMISHKSGYSIDPVDNPDLIISTTPQDVETERKLSVIDYGENEYRFTAIQRKFAEWLPSRDAFVLHSAVFDVDGVGVAFAAHSGTGKTTHLRLWKKFLGEKMRIVNGDKPVIRFFPEEKETPYGYGSPWSGKERFGTDSRTVLKHICFIERATENSVVPMRKEDAINRIFNQVYMPHTPMGVMKTMELIDRLLSSCQLWQINCNMELSAAQTAYEGIFGSVKE